MAGALILRPAPMGNAAASATAAGSALNVGNDYAGLVWRASGGSAWLDVDLSGNVLVDTVMLFGVDLAGAGATLQVSGRTDAQGPFGSAGGNWWDGAAQPLHAGAERLANGRSAALWQLGLPAIFTRYLRLSFASLGGGIEVGRVAAGERLRLERNFSFGGTFGVREFGSVDFSARAVLLRRRARRLRTLGLSFEHVRRDEVEAQVAPLIEIVGNTEPVAIVTDPEPHAMRARRSYFGPLVGDLGTVWRSAAGWRWQANLVSLF